MIETSGRFHSKATDHVVAGANEILDDDLHKKQSEINAENKSFKEAQTELNEAQSDFNSEVREALGTGGTVDERIADAVNTEKERAESAEGELDGRLETLEEAVGDGGSVDERIAAEGAKHYTKEETYNKTELNNLITTPNQGYITVDTYASLPATGSADIIYRVSNYDGSTSQVDATKYSEYAWDGTQYIFLCVKSQIGEVFDITAYNSNTKYADLAAALNGGANIPQSLRKGGMSVKFVQSSDNKYVQYRLMNQNWSTVVADWQGVDNEPTPGSNNLVKSWGVANSFISINSKLYRYKTIDDIFLSAINCNASIWGDVYIEDDYQAFIIDIRDYVGKYIYMPMNAQFGQFAFFTNIPNYGNNVPYVSGENLHTYIDVFPYLIPEGAEYMFLRANSKSQTNKDYDLQILDVPAYNELFKHYYSDIQIKNNIQLEYGFFYYPSINVGSEINVSESESGTTSVFVRKKIHVKAGDVLSLNVIGGNNTYGVVVTDSSNVVLFYDKKFFGEYVVSVDGFIYIQNNITQWTQYSAFYLKNSNYLNFNSNQIDGYNRTLLQEGKDFTIVKNKAISIVTGLIDTFAGVDITSEIQVKKGDIIQVYDIYTIAESYYAIAFKPGRNNKYVEGLRISYPVNRNLQYNVPYDGVIQIALPSAATRIGYIKIYKISGFGLVLSNKYARELTIRENIFNADYIGNFTASESSSGFFVSIKNNIPKGYCCYGVSNDNEEKHISCHITEFFLQEPSNRQDHTIVSVGDVLNIGGVDVELQLMTQDATICDIDDSTIYMTFRSVVDNEILGIEDEGTSVVTFGIIISKENYRIVQSDFITIDGVIPVFQFDIDWSNTNIKEKDGRYYRCWRKDNVGTFVIVSDDLFTWKTYLDLSMYAPATENPNYDETSLDISDGIMYCAIRYSPVIVVRYDMSQGQDSGNVATNTNSQSTQIYLAHVRPSIAVHNGLVYVMGSLTNLYQPISSFNVCRNNVGISVLDLQLNNLELYEIKLPVGCNYNLLYSYKSQLLCILNMDKQNQDASSALGRCGVYFTSLYSLY